MKTIKIIFTTLLLLLSVASVYAQGRKISGKILSPLNKPIEGAIISAVGSKDAKTGVDGTFKMELKENTTQISVWAAGYYPETRLVDDNSQVVILMMPESTYKYNESAILPMRIESSRPELTSAVNINKKDFTQGSMKIDRALAGQVAGLKTTRAGGMPGEGSYMNLRGIRSFVGSNAPLVVINGVPYLPDSRESPIDKWIFERYISGI